jgi:multiple antibiotic resistance protein
VYNNKKAEEFLVTLYTLIITFILVMDPLGNIPVFISILSSVSEERRSQVILRESFIAFIILTLFLFFGQHILNAINISESALRCAGGIILFLIALKMIFPKDETTRDRHVGEPFVVPLAIPMLAGPSAIATAIIMGTQYKEHLVECFTSLAIASAFCSIVLVFSNSLRKFLGQKGLVAIERLMGMVLTTVAVQMFLAGIDQFFHVNEPLPSHAVGNYSPMTNTNSMQWVDSASKNK